MSLVLEGLVPSMHGRGPRQALRARVELAEAAVMAIRTALVVLQRALAVFRRSARRSGSPAQQPGPPARHPRWGGQPRWGRGPRSGSGLDQQEQQEPRAVAEAAVVPSLPPSAADSAAPGPAVVRRTRERCTRYRPPSRAIRARLSISNTT